MSQPPFGPTASLKGCFLDDLLISPSRLWALKLKVLIFFGKMTIGHVALNFIG